jgi:hypothetical protein
MCGDRIEVQLVDANTDILKVLKIANDNNLNITLKLKYFRNSDQLEFAEILTG